MRFLLDSNIVSEPHRPSPDPAAVARLTVHQWASAIAAPVWYELLRGAEALPAGKRRASLDNFLARITAAEMAILPYDSRAAEVHARAEAKLRKDGVVVRPIDAQIASIAVANALVLVTRNVRDFRHFPDLKLENWFD